MRHHQLADPTAPGWRHSPPQTRGPYGADARGSPFLPGAEEEQTISPCDAQSEAPLCGQAPGVRHTGTDRARHVRVLGEVNYRDSEPPEPQEPHFLPRKLT